jgi:mannonate dehydratase
MGEWPEDSSPGNAAALNSCESVRKRKDHMPTSQDVPAPATPLTAGEQTTDGQNIRVTDVRAVCTAPSGIRLVIVKVQTTDDGLYGVGCATFTQRPLAVVAAIEQYLRPFLVGRRVDDIEDIWQAAYLSSYWRSGPVLNNALSGVDEALWDIKGKRAGVPVYQLFGGKCRRFASVYVHASGRDLAELRDRVAAHLEGGFQYVRCQMAVSGFATYGVSNSYSASRGGPPSSDRLAMEQAPWEPRPYCLVVPKMFDFLRSEFGSEVEFLHDVHERVPPIMALQLAKDLEPYKLFFLEDVFAPEDNAYFRVLRAQSSIPIAMGELFVNQHEYVPLVTERLIDFIRVHVSDIGGLTPARKLAVLCEFFGVRTAWHGPGDVSPVGHMANLHLDVSCPNFGIQEAQLFDDACVEVFPGCPEIRDGAMWPNERPGLGIDVDERAAARFPFPEHPLNGAWPEIRRSDGTVVRP